MKDQYRCNNNEHVLVLDNYAEGFLVKQGARVKNWKRRYFIFSDGCLSYRKDQRKTSKVLGKDIVEDVFYWSGAEFGLTLKLGSGRSMHVSPTSERQACIWYEVMRGYVMRQQMITQLQRVKRQRKQHLEPIWETDDAAKQNAGGIRCCVVALKQTHCAHWVNQHLRLHQVATTCASKNYRLWRH